jgi:hypothetical protein
MKSGFKRKPDANYNYNNNSYDNKAAECSRACAASARFFLAISDLEGPST